jgi:hypothetical protein
MTQDDFLDGFPQDEPVEAFPVPSPLPAPPSVPGAAAIQMAMKAEIDRLNDNRMFLIAALDELRGAFVREREQNDQLRALLPKAVQ